ncbi:MAG TPA: hypothetical protein VFZ53_00200 [Polyangiaceae bacterium]
MTHLGFVLACLALFPACARQSSVPQPSAQPAESPATQKPTGKRAPCTLGADQTCNEDPAVSAIWGRCTESGTCECKPGFELGPSGYCRPAPR